MSLLFWGMFLPLIGSAVSVLFFPSVRLEWLATHASIELIGGLAAIIIFVLLSFGTKSLKLKQREIIFLSAALLSMGLLDIFHALVPPGNNFVWFHSAATFAGGLFFACVRLIQHQENYFTKIFLPIFLATVALGATSIVYPESMPRMVENGEFTVLARMMNMGGGIGFLIAAWHFYRQYDRFHSRGYYLLSAHCLLFGMAGILFELSTLWDLAWWWWHILRLVAYFVLVGFVIQALTNSQEWRAHQHISIVKIRDSAVYVLGLIGLALGVSVIFGWHTHNLALIQINPKFAPMQYNTALGFVLLSSGVLSLASGMRSAAAFFGANLFLLAGLTTLQYPLHLDIGIDQFFVDAYVQTKTSHPGRMAPNTGICFTLAALTLIFSQKKIVLLSLSATALFLSSSSLIGYIFGESSFYGWGQLTRMALHTSIGFVFCSLALLTMLLFSKNQKRTIDLWAAAPFMVATLLTTITLLGWYLTYETAKRDVEEHFHKMIADGEDILEDRFLLYKQSLWGAAGLFNASEVVDRHEWRAYVDSLDIRNRLPGINGLGYIDYVREENVEKYLEQARKDDAPDFINHPITDFQDKFVIRYILPLEGNRQAIGLDIGFEANRREAAELARDEAMPALTKKIELVQDNQKRAGFLVLIPVYKTIDAPDTIDERRKVIKGWVYAPFIGQSFLDGLNALNNQQLEFSVYDGDVISEEHLIYRSDISEPPANVKDLVYESKLHYANRNWTIVWKPSINFIAPSGALLPTIVITVGLVLTFAFSILFYLLSRIYGQTARDLEIYLARLKQAKQEAENAHQIKSDFLSSVSHEIRTPLNAIVVGMELLRPMLSGEKAENMARIVNASAENLVLLVNDILDLSKIESGSLQLSIEPFNIKEVCTNVVYMMKSLAEEKGNRLEINISDDFAPMIEGDSLRVRQVLINFLSNAMKFTKNGEVSLNVAIDEETADTLKLHFSVSDSGIGIPADKIDQIFEKFRQVDAGTAKHYGGTGLGLAICSELAYLMGGEIGVESELGKGSTFWFTANFTKVKQGAKTDKADSAKANKDIFKGKTVLLAEDDSISRMVMKKMLEYLGFEVEQATNGKEALKKAKAKAYDVILTDCQMPLMDGYEAVEKMRKADVTAKILALTGNEMPEEHDRCIAAGMNDHITKPVRKDELARMLEKWLKDT